MVKGRSPRIYSSSSQIVFNAALRRKCLQVIIVHITLDRVVMAKASKAAELRVRGIELVTLQNGPARVQQS